MLRAPRLRIVARWTAVLSGIALAAGGLLIIYGVALVDQAMEAGRRPLAAPILPAPLVLESGQPWGLDELRAALVARGMPEARGESGVGPGEFAVGHDSMTMRGPWRGGDTEPVLVRPGQGGLVLARPDGRPQPRVELEPRPVGAGQGDVVRWPVAIADVSPALLTAVVDLEDAGFLSHGGLSFRGLLRAAVKDVLSGGIREGGSTITQQLAKILLLRPDRTVPRKLTEAWLAALLDYRYEKRAILEVYLNRVYLGQDGGTQLQGVEAASAYYFGKRCADLTLPDAALLAGLIAAPNRYDPFTHPSEARSRRRAALAAMARAGHIAPVQVEVLDTAPLPAVPHRIRWGAAAQFVAEASRGTPPERPLATTLEPEVQWALHAGIEAGLKRLEERYTLLRNLARNGDPLQVAVVVVADDGRVLALQGSRNGQPGGFNRAVGARRQIGSLVKPFVAVLAIEQGRSLEDTVEDAPLSVTTGRQIWTPENSDGRFRGRVTFKEALVHSLNVPMVRIGLEIGVERTAARLGRLGFAADPNSPATLLGAFEATPIEVARAYAALASGGVSHASRYQIANGAAPPARVMDQAACATVLAALREVVSRGTAARLGGSVIGDLAAKTGTTDRRRDSWFVALRPRCVTVVWLGTDANQETGLYGAIGALEIWADIDARLPLIWKTGRLATGV